MSGHSEGFMKFVKQAQQNVTEITTEQLKKLQKEHPNLVLVDVREDNEVNASGTAPGAMHIGKGVIDRDIEQKIPDKSVPIVMFCRSGYRSLIAAQQALDIGYTNVCSLQGGYIAWCKAQGCEAPISPFAD